MGRNVCAVNDTSLLIPLIQDGVPAGRTYAGSFVQALRCPHCAYVTFPAPDSELLRKFYQDEYPSGSASWSNVDADYAEWKTSARAGCIEELIGSLGVMPGATLHEFGCAFGGTVQALQRRGYDVSGTELNENAVRAGRARGNDKIFAEDCVAFLRRSRNPPDVVYSWHAIEHFTKPFEFLADLKREIATDGLLILIVPSSAARFPLIYGHLRYVWFGYPEHLHLFSPGCAPSIAQEIGMSLVHVYTREFGIEPAATGVALKQSSDAARWLVHGDPAWLGEELIMVFRNGPAEKPDDRQRRLLLDCDRAAAVERRALDALESNTVDPWGAAAVT